MKHQRFLTVIIFSSIALSTDKNCHMFLCESNPSELRSREQAGDCVAGCSGGFSVRTGENGTFNTFQHSIQIMDRLPFEVCYQITAHLTCNEKQNLSLLSRRWHKMIKNYNMHSHLTIDGKDNFAAAISYFEENGRQRQQVKSLRLVDTEANSIQISRIPHQFPSLKDFSWINQQYNRSYRPMDLEKLEFWRNITSYEEHNDFPLFGCLSTTGIFSNLTRLILKYQKDEKRCYDRYFRSAWEDLPKVKYADLTGISLHLFELNAIHKHWPLLETLHLTRFHQPLCYEYEIWEQKMSIDQEDWFSTPAKRLTELKLQEAIPHKDQHSVGLSALWLTYIGKKYTNLMHLTINDTNLARSRDRRHNGRLATLASSFAYLETYNVDYFPITTEIALSFDKCGAQLQHVHLYNDPLFQLDCLQASLQWSSIQSITLTTDLMSMYIYSALSSMLNLRHLTLNSVSGQAIAFLEVILGELKQLKSLAITNNIIKPINISAEDSSFTTELQTLILMDVTILNAPCSDVDQYNSHMAYIARKCPSLSNLTINGKTQDATRLFKVEFPHFRLASLDIHISNMTYYKIYNENLIVWYKHDETGKLTSFSKKPDLKGGSYVSIVYEGHHTNVRIGNHNIPKWWI